MQDLGLAYDDRHSQQHMAYVQNWISVLEKDPNELFRAIRDAEEITGYIKRSEDMSSSSKWETYEDRSFP